MSLMIPPHHRFKWPSRDIVEPQGRVAVMLFSLVVFITSCVTRAVATQSHQPTNTPHLFLFVSSVLYITTIVLDTSRLEPSRDLGSSRQDI